MLIGTSLVGFGSGRPNFIAKGVNFDGTNDYLTKTTDLTGNADSKLWTGSLWFKRGATGSNQRIITNNGTVRYSIKFRTTDVIQIEAARPSAGAIALDIASSAITDTASWHHLLFSVDMANAANRHLFIDDVSDLATVTTYDDFLLDFTDTTHAVGARSDGASKLDGDLAELWMDFGRFVDLSVVANRRKFITSGLCPVHLGRKGALPFDAEPIEFFSGNVDDWHTNKGSGGGFTENGALTASATNPC